MRTLIMSPTDHKDPTVTYHLDEAAFMRGCNALWAYRAIGRFGNYLVAVMVGLIAVFLLWQGVPGPWAYILLGCAGLFLLLDAARDRLWRRHYRGLEKYRGPITATVSDAGVGVDGPEGVHLVPWQQFRSFLSTGDFLFLIIDQRRFSIIPRSAFETPAEASRFEDMVANHLPRLPKKLL